MNLKGAVTIVTGSASGIGAASARMLAAKGSNVVINYTKSEASAKAVAAECEAKGVETLLCRANVADDADCRRMVAETVAKWGRVDGLINNAGTTKFVLHPDLDGLDAADFLAIYRVNVVGPFQMSRAVAPHMKKQGRGAIVNISSVAGVIGVGSSIAYATSKGALNTLTLSLARVLGPEIRVNTVCPGFVAGSWLRDGMGAERYDATKAHLEATTPLRRAGTPEAMAEVAVWFLEGGEHVTGEILMVDSGNHLGAAPLKAR
jgi:3-oxoacyl-[acyl-carrier protein] reductase